MAKVCGIVVEKYSDLLVLNDKCTTNENKDVYPTTSLMYSLSTTIAAIFLIITYIFYKRVKILNCNVYVHAMTNTIWTIYFLFVFVRSIFLAIQYGQALHHDGWFFTNWIFGLLELFSLYYSLGCQWTNHHRAFVNQEVDHITKETRKFNIYKRKLRLVVSRRGVIILLELVGCLLFIILLRFWDEWAMKWFWLYVSLLCLMMISCTLVSLLIGYSSMSNQTNTPSNMYFFIGTLLSIPEHIPVFVWSHCASVDCWGKFSMFDLWILLKIVSLILIFRGLVVEYKWFSEECQYAVLHEVDEYASDASFS